MRVALDISHLTYVKRTGVEMYIAELFRALRGLPDIDVVLVRRLSKLGDLRRFELQGFGVRLWLPPILESRADVLHSSDFRGIRAARAARVVTIHDLAFLRAGMTWPEFATKKKRQLDALLDERTPDALIAVSEATRRDLLAYRPALAEHVRTVLHGGDHVARLPSSRNGEIESGPPYFLFVGNLEPRKNVSGLLQAFEIVCQRADEVRLVLIGKPEFGGDAILATARDSPWSHRIRALGYCSPAVLQAYYRHAIALVYPSWIEGFGLPVIEAMRLRCPVITSATTSTAEIAGDTAWLVDPADVNAIAQAMLHALELGHDPARRAIWVTRAEERAATFTWERCARETAAVYEKALG